MIDSSEDKRRQHPIAFFPATQSDTVCDRTIMANNESARAVAKLRQKIDNLMESVSLLEVFLNKFNPVEHTGQVQARLDKLEEHFNLFFEVAAELEAMSTEKCPISLQKQRFDFETKYYAMKAVLLSKLPKQDLDSATTIGVVACTSAPSHLRYPELRLVEFSGCPEHWVSFRDSFTAGVINRSEIQGVEKLQYLKGLVHGDAARLVGHVEVSDDGFKMAWKMLQQRYDSKRRLIFCHLETLYGTLPMQSESRDELLRLIDSFEEQLANLKRLGEPTEQWSSSLVYHLYTRLDDNTRREWDRHINAVDFKQEDLPDAAQEFPKFDEMVSFLQGYARILPPTQPHNHPRRPASNAEWSQQQQF